MSNRSTLTLTKTGLTSLALAASLAACSILPGTGPSAETGSNENKVDPQALKGLADQARAAKAQTEARTEAGSGAAGQPGSLADAVAQPTGKADRAAALAGGKTALKTARAQSVTNAANDDDREPQTPAAKPGGALSTPADRHAAALALLRKAGAKATDGDRRLPEDDTRADFARPRTYRLDGPPGQQAYGQGGPQGQASQPYVPQYAQQPYGGQTGGQYAGGQSPNGLPLGDNGQPLQSYPRTPSSPFEPPQQIAQAGGFQPPDLAPGAVRPSDPRALMEAVERLRAKQVQQPARIEREDQAATTGSVPAPAAEFTPASPLTFIQFEKGATALSPASLATIAGMLKPFTKTKGSKVVASVGLGGAGEAYVKLLQANQRAQAVASAIPQDFEVIRRFDPGLPNESVRLFVVRSP